MNMMRTICCFNGAKDTGEKRFDPRFDCQALAVWHVLLARDAAKLTMDGQSRQVFTCEEHIMNIYYSLAMYHRVMPLCVGSSSWNLQRNVCESRYPTR